MRNFHIQQKWLTASSKTAFRMSFYVYFRKIFFSFFFFSFFPQAYGFWEALILYGYTDNTENGIRE